MCATMNPTSDARALRDAFFANAAKTVSSPEELGIVLNRHLNGLLAAGEVSFDEEGMAEVPMTVSVRFNADPLAREHCYRSCWTVLGAEVLCLKACETMTAEQ